MLNLISRNCFVAGISLCELLTFCAYTASAQQDQQSGKFHFKETDGKSLGLWENEQPVLVYNFGEISRPQIKAATPRSSYVHPIYGLEGEVLTDDFPADHFHHHGLFWGWPHVKIGDHEYDLWKGRGIRIGFLRWLAKESGAEGAKLGVENGWFVGDEQVMQEEVWLNVHPASSTGRTMDVSLKWTPLDKSVTLGGAEGKSYGGLTLRFAPRKETTITVPSGRTSEDLLISKLPWADLSAKFQGASGPSGVALFVDPHHPDFPPEWMTRDYGVLAVGWPGVNSKTFAASESVTCNYRLWIHRGIPLAAEIQKAYEEFAKRAQ